MPWREWLRTYKDHERGGHYLLAPGSQDITAQVLLDQLPTGFIAMTQAHFLQQWGIDDFVREGVAYWENMTGTPDIAALKMRSRVAEREALTEIAGLGGLTCMTWIR
jgi:hypothetical protein